MLQLTQASIVDGRLFFQVVSSSKPVESFDLTLGFDPNQVDLLTGLSVTAPTGWSVVSNRLGTGALLVGGYTTTETPVAAGSTLLQLSLSLKTPFVAQARVTLEGTYNDPAVDVPATSVLLGAPPPPVNHPPTGDVVINVPGGGVPKQGQTLTASNTLADADGLGPIAYTWKAGAATLGSGPSYTLTPADVGKTVTVTASYTDGKAFQESSTSTATAPVVPDTQNPDPAAGVQGLAYHWKSHHLLGGVAIQRLDASAVEPTPAQAFDLRAAAIDSAAGRLSVEVWVNPAAVLESVDFAASGPAGSTLSFTSALGTNWTVLSNNSEQGTLLMGAYMSNLDAGGLLQTTRVGTLQVQAGAGAGVADLGVSFSDILLGTSSAPSVSVAMTTAVSGADGSFELGSPAAGGRDLVVTRPVESSVAPAVNLQDAVAILKMIANQPVNAPGRPLSPYQALAADFDGNGAVSLADALGVLRHAVGLPSATAPRWAFVDEADLGMPARATTSPGVVPATLAGVTPVNGHVGLVGVLRGDVDGSWAAPAGTARLDAAYFTDLEQRLDAQHPSAGFELSQWGVYPG